MVERKSYRVAPLFNNEKRLKCKHCDKDYANATTLHRHQRKDHRKKFLSFDDFLDELWPDKVNK